MNGTPAPRSCESLPVVLVGTKDELGMNEELRGRVAAAAADLALPEPLPVAAADAASLAGVYRWGRGRGLRGRGWGAAVRGRTRASGGRAGGRVFICLAGCV